MKNITKKQHYIPQCILRNHAYNSQTKQRKLICQYDKEKDEERIVPIKSVCCEDFLYEIRDTSGEIVNGSLNLIENIFAKIENEWNCVINKIIEKRPLSKDDVCFLYILIAMQTLRMPETISYTAEYIQKHNNKITNVEADTLAKLASFISMEPNPKVNWALDNLFSILTPLNLIIINSDKEFIINDKRPVLYLNIYDRKEYCYTNVYFPVTPYVCVSLIAEEPKESDIKITEDMTDFINKEMCTNEGRFLYSSKSIRPFYKSNKKQKFKEFP